MNFIVGDEVGLVKAISITEVDKIPKPEVKRWGQIDRKREVLRMCMNTGKSIKTPINGAQFSVARKDGSVQVMSVIDGAIISDVKVYTPAVVDKKKSLKVTSNNKKSEQFVGINCHDGIIYACTDMGKFYIIDANKSTPEIKTVDLKQDNLWCMKVHPKESNIFATGGEERELCIWDLNKMEEDDESEQENTFKIKPIFTAKNVKHDFLNLRVPVWVTCMEWLDDNDTTKIIIGTGHHHIRVYDTKKARRPILSVEIGEYPIRSLSLNKDRSQVIFSDTIGTVTSVDVKTGKALGTFKGFAGSVSDVWCNPEEDILATVALDRHLRIFSTLGKRPLLHKVYLKTRINCVLGDLTFVDVNANKEDEENQEENQEENIWDNMKLVKDDEEKSSKKRKLASKEKSSNKKLK
ncbi:WD40 repeat-like protein [Piromyces finnis]|uniref:Ribosome biogenesis protein NSA1 n=1 Tax=Piromyces finnis TaxID=1754191 RepID=A0A1Y1VKR2_9FUNG|nr:WD40 repeat-like protein [Piromyces finnis]|eukprot:ORX58625.1 WD40 repeat-like protein [Piromyces finnis]